MTKLKHKQFVSFNGSLKTSIFNGNRSKSIIALMVANYTVITGRFWVFIETILSLHASNKDKHFKILMLNLNIRYSHKCQRKEDKVSAKKTKEF